MRTNINVKEGFELVHVGWYLILVEREVSGGSKKLGYRKEIIEEYIFAWIYSNYYHQNCDLRGFKITFGTKNTVCHKEFHFGITNFKSMKFITQAEHNESCNLTIEQLKKMRRSLYLYVKGKGDWFTSVMTFKKVLMP